MDEMQASAHDQAANDAHPATRADLAVIHERLDRGSQKMQSQDAKIDLLTAEVGMNTELTQKVLEIVAMGRAVFRFFERVALAVRWVGKKLYWLVRIVAQLATWIGAIWALIYAFTHHGEPPKLH